MKIVAFAGSSSTHSINRKLVQFALNCFKDENDEKKLLDLNDYEMPLFSVDRERKGYPDAVMQFRREFEQADCIITSLAEHNKAYTVAFKNILDWCSRIDMNIFKNKPMLLMSTSPGAFGGRNVLNLAKTLFPKCNARIIESFSLPLFEKTFHEDRGITDRELKEEFEKKIAIFREKLAVKA